MSKKYYSGSDMYKNHRDMIAKILEQAEKMDEEHGSDCECEECMESEEQMNESDKDFIEKAKKEIEDETDRAIEVAVENGQIFDNVSHMDWFVQAVADKIKEDSQLDEKDLIMGHISSKYDLKKHIANNFDHYKDNIMRLYPQDLKNTKEVFLRFLKDQELDKEKLNELSKTLAKKIREVGDAYDEMAQFVDMVIQVS
jgi:hypothetical protein